MTDLSGLPTEAINEDTRELSRVSTREAMFLINDEDHKVAPAVRECVDEIARAVDEIAPRLQNGGRLFYIGAGTSGRLGILDASECPPTFGTDPEMVQGIIAGGLEAVFKSREGAEDESEAGVLQLQQRGFSASDCLVGIAASGRTPYVIGALKFAREMGALTIGLTMNPDATLKEWCDIFIAPVVGAEALTGSTRMKSGSAQKMVLNMISTGVMLRLGKVEGNLMLKVQAWCEKLVDRQQRLVMEMAGVDEARARRALDENHGDVDTAVRALKASPSLKTSSSAS
jgi:N-acetylmuramic acid 6-phosphate etherase